MWNLEVAIFTNPICCANNKTIPLGKAAFFNDLTTCLSAQFESRLKRFLYLFCRGFCRSDSSAMSRERSVAVELVERIEQFSPVLAVPPQKPSAPESELQGKLLLRRLMGEQQGLQGDPQVEGTVDAVLMLYSLV